MTRTALRKTRDSAIHESLLARYDQGGRVVLLFDYDGTLAPIVEHPSLARLGPAMRRLLARLAGRPRVDVGILSGRSLDDLRAMADLDGLLLAGTAGLELDFRGRRVTHPEAERLAERVDLIVRTLRQELGAFPGAWVENKPHGLTLHYRAVNKALVAPLRARVLPVFRAFASEIHLTDGPMAIEAIPAVGWNKGTALCKVLEFLQAVEPMVLYAGDSQNDLEAMEMVESLGGISIGIGPHPPAIARYRLPDPAAVLDLLTAFDAALDHRERRRYCSNPPRSVLPA